MGNAPPRRHDWVWLSPESGEGEFEDGNHADAGASQLATAWREAGRPFVVARRLPDDPIGAIRLGLATPDKRRIGFTVSPDDIAEAAPAPTLAEVVPVAPAAWREPLSALDRALREIGVVARIFGSLAWEYRGGLSFVRRTSDLDLLLEPDTGERAERLLDILSGCPATPRLDGEIVLPDGWAVAWRELALRPASVLVKGPTGVAMRPFADVMELFEAV